MQSKEVVELTITELESAWGHDRDEWPLLGPPANDAEVVVVVARHYQGEPGTYYTVDRTNEDGGSYVAIDEHFDWDDIEPLLDIGRVLTESLPETA